MRKVAEEIRAGILRVYSPTQSGYWEKPVGLPMKAVQNQPPV